MHSTGVPAPLRRWESDASSAAIPRAESPGPRTLRRPSKLRLWNEQEPWLQFFRSLSDIVSSCRASFHDFDPDGYGCLVNSVQDAMREVGDWKRWQDSRRLGASIVATL